MAEMALKDGRAFQRFRLLVQTQGGDVRYVDNLDLFPKAQYIQVVPAGRGGYLSAINARIVGETSVELGAGRARKTDPIDPAVGIEILHKVGDRVAAGDPLFIIHANDPQKLEAARERLEQAHTWSDRPVEPLPLFYGVVE